MPTLDAALIARLGSTPLFAELDVDARAALFAQGAARSLTRGQNLFLEGDRADAFYVVLEGWMKLYRITPSGAEAVVHVIASGETFAEAVAFLGQRYPVNAEAASDAKLLRIEIAAVRRLISDQPTTAFAMMASLAHHTETLMGQVEVLKAMTAPERIADFFLRLAGREEGRARLTLPHDKQLIARRLGMTPESFSRALTRLQAAGVKVDRDRVEIKDCERLREFVLAED